MFYAKVILSVILFLTVVFGGIPNILNGELDIETIFTLICCTLIVFLLVISAYKDIKNGKLKKETRIANKQIKLEMERQRYNELQIVCSKESNAIEKLNIIKNFNLDPYSKSARKIISNKKNVPLRINQTNFLINANLLVQEDLTMLTEIFNQDYQIILEQEMIHQQKKQDRLNAITESQHKNPKYVHKQNKKNGIVTCPKCSSTSITTSNKKLSVTRGVVGGAILGPVGAGVGALTSKKIYCVCMNCGHKWQIGK